MKKKRPAEEQPAESRLEEMRLVDMIPHPDQEKYFRKYPTFEYAALKADIAANGLQQAIEVMPPGNAAGLPAGTILKGHTRHKILLELGRETTRALVRYDLLGAPRAKIDHVFLTDNVARRQQDRLGMARAAVGLFRAEREQKGRGVIGDPLRYAELRDRIGRIVGMSGRNLQRYLSVLAAPLEVQDAFEEKRVKLVDAARVAALPKEDQEQLAARLKAGEDAKEVFAEFFPPKGGRHVKTGDAVACLARSLERACADFEGRVGRVKPGPVRRNEEALRAGERLIRHLLGLVDK